MTGHDGSIYRSCREAAGLTQEAAAEGLSCSVRQLARYESGEQEVPDDIAYRMAVLYDSQYLALQHLRLVSHVAAELLPPVAVLDLAEAVLTLINRGTELEEKYRRMMQIAEDNAVDDRERPDYQQIKICVLQMIAAGFGFLYAEAAGIKKERPEVAASRRSVQGLRKTREQQQNYYITNPGKCKPRLVREGVARP